MSVNVAKKNAMSSRNAVSVQEIRSMGEVSQVKWSMMLESAEIQLKSHDHRWKDNEKSSQPRTNDKLVADSAVHYCHVMQGLTNGHVPIIGHSSQKEKFCCTKEYEEKDLGHARMIGNGPVSCYNADQKSRNTHCGE